jgi:hypothetical protein
MEGGNIPPKSNLEKPLESVSVLDNEAGVQSSRSEQEQSYLNARTEADAVSCLKHFDVAQKVIQAVDLQVGRMNLSRVLFKIQKTLWDSMRRIHVFKII